jgi:hypothetical protein
MVKGIDIFRERFRQHEGAFTLIGGAACDEWFAAQGLPFRATKDLDIVLAEFLRAFPAESGNWRDILASLKSGPGGGIKPETLIEAIRTYFQIPAK